MGDWSTVVTHVGFAIGVIASALYSFLSHRHARQANDAVNHRHVSGTPRIYDIVIDTNHLATHNSTKVNEIDTKVDKLVHWRESYVGGPLENGEGAAKFVKAIHDELKRCKEREPDDDTSD